MSYVFNQPVAIQVPSNQLSLGLGPAITINCVPPIFGNLTYNLNSTGLNSDIVTNTYNGPINFNVQNENPTNIGTGSYLGTITIGNPNATVQFASTISSVPANDLLINIGQDDINNVLQIGDRVTVLINPNGGTVNIGAGNSTANMNFGNNVGPSTINFDGIVSFRSTSSIFTNQLSANQFLYANGSNKVIGLGPLTDGQLLIGATGTTPNPSTLTAGSGVTITNAPGSITISATGSGGTVTSISAGTGITLTPNPITSTGTVSLSTPVGPNLGGTGTNNGSNKISIQGNITFSGAFAFTANLTGVTSVTYPTSGILATTTAIYQDFFCVSRCGGV